MYEEKDTITNLKRKTRYKTIRRYKSEQMKNQ